MTHGAAGTRPSTRVEQAYQHCMRLARSHYENFPVASRLLDPGLRPAVAAIYAFARVADDIADEGDASPDKRLKQLDAWETLLERCQTEDVAHPVFLALGDTIRRHGLPVSALRDLLIAFRMDVSIHAYATFEELCFYCRHSANPVGRLMLALHGVASPEAVAASDALCTALQLTNFWQDLSRDIARGRCYLPEEWLNEVGASREALMAGEADSVRIAPALDRAVACTRALFGAARLLPAMLPFRLRLQVVATWHGGRRVLEEVARLPDPLRQRPALGASAWVGLAPRVLLETLLPRRLARGEVRA